MTDARGPVPEAVPVLPVADLDRALAFSGRLGFGLRARFDGYAIVGLEQPGGGGPEVHLTEVPEVAGTETWTGAYLRVSDADAVHARWTALGIATLDAPDDRDWAMREFALEDPDGNLWRVGSPVGGQTDDLVAPAAAERPAAEPVEASDVVGSSEPGDGPEVLHVRAIGAEVRDLAHAFGRLLAGADDDAVRARPEPGTWSALEHGVVVRDLLVVSAERIVRALAETEPVLGGWDAEAAVADPLANESDVSAVADDLGRNAAKLSEALRMVGDEDWARGATVPGDERVTVEDLARAALDEVIRHQAEAAEALAAVDSGAG